MGTVLGVLRALKTKRAIRAQGKVHLHARVDDAAFLQRHTYLVCDRRPGWHTHAFVRHGRPQCVTVRVSIDVVGQIPSCCWIVTAVAELQLGTACGHAVLAAQTHGRRPL